MSGRSTLAAPRALAALFSAGLIGVTLAGCSPDQEPTDVPGTTPPAASTITATIAASTSAIAADGTCISLRVLRPARQDLSALIGAGAIAAPAADLLADEEEAEAAAAAAAGEEEDTDNA